jgi:hypothetical protein
VTNINKKIHVGPVADGEERKKKYSVVLRRCRVRSIDLSTLGAHLDISRSHFDHDVTMRPIKACLQCRKGKRKCDRQVASACPQCTARGLRCSDATSATTSPQAQPPVPIPSATDEETLYLVDLYFRYIHDQPHSLFHKPTLRQNIIAGSVSQPVLMGMLGNAAR